MREIVTTLLGALAVVAAILFLGRFWTHLIISTLETLVHLAS